MKALWKWCNITTKIITEILVIFMHRNNIEPLKTHLFTLKINVDGFIS